jgi:hypothetical protein
MPLTNPASTPVDPTIILWFFFVVGMAVTAYFMFAHLYHWLRYAGLYPLVWVALPIYLIGIFVLVTTMLGAIALT